MERGDHLFQCYLERRDEASFRELVEEHSPMVTATALRKLRGDHEAAKEVSQLVFVNLLKKASSLEEDICLAGWLYRQAYRIAVDLIQKDRRRKAREKASISLRKMNKDENRLVLGELDDALEGLEEEDRDVLVLKYLGGRSDGAVGEHFGISSEAAGKRCDRALAALRIAFEQRSIRLGTSRLVAVLETVSPPPASVAFVDGVLQKISEKREASAGVATSVLSVVAGFFLALLMAGGAFVYQTQAGRKAGAERAVRVSERSMHEDRSIGSLDETISVEALIAQVKMLYLEPKNALLDLRMAALFDALPVDEREAFFRESADSFTELERYFAYDCFLEIWMQEEPAEAFDLMLSEGMISRDFTAELGSVSRLLGMWVRKSPDEAEDWVRKNWGHEELVMQGFGATLQGEIAGALVQRTLEQKGVREAFEMAGSFGEGDDLVDNLSRITGTPWLEIDKGRAVEIYEHVCRIADPRLREKIRESMLKFWKEREVEHLMGSLPLLAPEARIPAALEVLTYLPRKEVVTKLANGEVPTSDEKVDLTEGELDDLFKGREDDLRQAALEAGLEVAEVERQIVARYFEERNDRALDLLKSVERGSRTDEVILQGIGSLCENFRSKDSRHEMTAFNGAMMISDAGKRLGVARALFHRIHAKDPEAAKGMLKDDGFPQEVGAALREISTQLDL